MMMITLTERTVCGLSQPTLDNSWRVSDPSGPPTYVVQRFNDVKIDLSLRSDTNRHDYRGVCQALRAGEVIRVDAMGWILDGYVVDITSYHNHAVVTLKLTGAPREDYSRRATRIARTEITRAQLEMTYSRSGVAQKMGRKLAAMGYGPIKPEFDLDHATVCGITLRDLAAAEDRLIKAGCFAGPSEYTLNDVKEKKVEKPVITKEAVKKNRYYVGSRGVLGLAVGHFRHDGVGWGKATLAEATAHATKLIEDRDGEEQFIVKIVRVVRRKPTPIVVEDVR